MTRPLVTGSSSGIGLATAVRLATAGHEVVATMRNPEADGDLRAAARSAGVDDSRITVVALDVDDDASVEAAFGRVLADHGPIDVLVNNAGTSPVAAVEDLAVGANASGPEEVADAIARVVADPEAPLRTTVGVGIGIDEMIALRSEHDDEEWIDLWSAVTSDFLDRYRRLTGIELAPGQT